MDPLKLQTSVDVCQDPAEINQFAVAFPFPLEYNATFCWREWEFRLLFRHLEMLERLFDSYCAKSFALRENLIRKNQAEMKALFDLTNSFLQDLNFQKFSL